MRSKARKAARSGQWGEAARYYRELCKQRNPSVKDQIQLGHVLKENEDFDAALTTYLHAADTNPHYVDAQRQAGLFLKLRGYRKEAATYFARALAMDGSLSDMRDELRSVGVKDDTARDACHLRGGLTSTEVQGHAPGLLARLRMALSLRQARAAARRKAWPEAENSYRKVLKYAPGQVRFLIQLGHALREQDKADEAVDCYRRALLLTPRDPELYIHLGAALKQQGRIDSALGAYLAAWRLRPGLPAAEREIRAISGDLTDDQIADLSGAYLRMDASAPDASSLASEGGGRRRLVEKPGLDHGQGTIFRFLAGSLAYKE
ncbi:tetratricopeptide repeat protein [Komagataeibacter rhaeticus]|uniref:Tetratricopeptide repeat protein n=1 Tax=Komagataeibacter rhaeticus TaxID=215221 RepID=A0A7H4IL70_9PROT|nr:tetratricopeptide repeat protein [Komagataeibacter rhaeticus]QIP34145.1 tetratricopeptide repeat protein [Komagataeibacter rhaeticus]QOC46503.1 tetratricopeptide repeat protein [Komagataeibacter rhaeticus]QOC46654.1 tetratricopeptide repeat protein [Komagataeibacter rhaeticus]WPP20977.1 tetratricopeptide repeat protein [Komagataeibacter rhaeticus]